jgi:hypothetical protein
VGVAGCVGDHLEGRKPGSVTRGPETESKEMAETGSRQAVEWPFLATTTALLLERVALLIVFTCLTVFQRAVDTCDFVYFGSL